MFLSRLFNRSARHGKHPVAHDTALLIVDVQKGYADPARGRGNVQTDQVSQKIQQLAPAFRAAGLPVYVIHTGDFWRRRNPDFHHFEPDRQDTLFRKSTDGAFTNGKLKKILERDGRKRILVCGFNLNACVLATAVGGKRRGFDVKLISDLTANDDFNEEAPEHALNYMRRKGIRPVGSKTALRWLASKSTKT